MKPGLLFLFVLMLASCGTLSKKSKQSAAMSSEHALELNVQSGRLMTGWYAISEEATAFKRELAEEQQSLFLYPEPIVNQSNFQKIEVGMSGPRGSSYHLPGLLIELDEEGTTRFAEATKENLQKRLGFVINDSLVYAPIIQSEITEGKVMVSGLADDLEGLDRLVEVLQH